MKRSKSREDAEIGICIQVISEIFCAKVNQNYKHSVVSRIAAIIQLATLHQTDLQSDNSESRGFVIITF